MIEKVGDTSNTKEVQLRRCSICSGDVKLVTNLRTKTGRKMIAAYEVEDGEALLEHGSLTSKKGIPTDILFWRCPYCSQAHSISARFATRVVMKKEYKLLEGKLMLSSRREVLDEVVFDDNECQV